jgi:hypothetical protein
MQDSLVQDGLNRLQFLPTAFDQVHGWAAV